jgi:hypothetical protein
VEHIFRRVLGAYVRGAPTISISERPRLSAATRDVITAFASRTQRMELVADDGRTVLFSESLSPAGGTLEDRIRQLGGAVIAFHRSAIAQWSELRLHDRGTWERLDDSIDREAWALLRAISQGDSGRTGTEVDGLTFWTEVLALERLADFAVTLGEAGEAMTELPPERAVVVEVRQLHWQILDHLEATLTARSERTANERLDVCAALIASKQAIAEWLLPVGGVERCTPAAAVTVERVLSALEGTIRCIQEIAQARLDRSLESPYPAPAPPPAEALLAA